jgi:hypothetical protein
VISAFADKKMLPAIRLSARVSAGSLAVQGLAVFLRAVTDINAD